MGRRDDSPDWEVLSAEDLRLVDEWLAIRDVTMSHRGWFDDGRSDQPVGLVVVHDGGLERFVLKICASKERVLSLDRAWKQSEPEFRDRHLLQRHEVIPLDGRWAVLCRVAGGHLTDVGALNVRMKEKDFPDICGRIVDSLVGEWNNNILRPTDLSPTVGVFLHTLIGKRMPAVYDWARRSGICTGGNSGRLPRTGWPQPLTNPFLLVAHEQANQLVEDVLVGRAHGDLSGRNIRVPAPGRGEPDDYVLIDADHFGSDAPLARDPMHLLVALALDWIDLLRLGPRQRRDLIKVIVAPRDTPTPESAEAFRNVSAAIWDASEQVAVHYSFGDVWMQQCLLCLVGMGLVHVGRDLRTADPVSAKEWCFDLAAMAAQAYLSEVDRSGQSGLRRTAGVQASQPGRLAGQVHQAAVTGRSGTGMLNHEEERARLRTTLTDGPWGVVVVHGPEGVGKTMLVNTVLSDMRLDTTSGPTLRVLQHDALPGIRLDVKTLVDDIAGGTEPAAAIRLGESSLTRLAAVLEAVGGRRAIIVIDPADRLLHGGTRELIDLDLDEAFEALATTPDHRVCVVFVTRDMPVSAIGGSWPTAITPIHLARLPYPYFVSFLGMLDGGRPRLSALEEPAIEELYRRLEGNPRSAELLHAVLTLTDHNGPDALVRALSTRSPAAVPQFLTGLLVEGLNEVRRDVLAALGAYVIPVKPNVVVDLVGENRREEQIRGALNALADSHLARRTGDGRYYVPAKDAEWMLSGAFRDRSSVDEERSRLLGRAADELSRFRIGQPQDVGDLEIHFAELRALMRARRHRLAYRLMHEIDQVLGQWNCSHLLLDQRQDIEGSLDGEDFEMANDNALGALYASRGHFESANAAYERALGYATALGDEGSRTRIIANTATMYWQQNDTCRAADRYEEARVAAMRHHEQEVLMGALEGLADCRRRWGEYDDAIRLASEALAVPAAADYPDTAEARDFASSRTLNVALKMARWYGDLDRFDDARGCINQALAAEVGRRDDWLRASCLDGRADLALLEGDTPAAMAHATEAIEHAVRLHDPITLMQARTTMCLAHLVAGNPLTAAAREIERAERYRRRGRSLLVVALRGLVARLEGRNRDAVQLFDDLLREAYARIDRDGRDFGAWDFAGLARCGKALDGSSVDRAVEAFRKAREMTPPIPGHVHRLTFLVERLDWAGSRPDQLRPVLDLLHEAARWPNDR